MRGAILVLIGLMCALLGNIIAYSVSEDYRFFVKKIKYKQELVYENEQKIDDTQRIMLVEENVNNTETTVDIVTVAPEGFTFLDALGKKEKNIEVDTSIGDLDETEKYVLEQLKESFVLEKNEDSISLFDITSEYPDQYHEYANKHLSVYMFSTKNYEQVFNIFDVLKYELPYDINETNSFGAKSFFINMQGVYADEKVRIVFEYKNKAFGLKIKKDSYNTVKQILQGLRAQK